MGCALSEALHPLGGALSEALHSLCGALSHALDSLGGTLADARDSAAGALADLAEGLARALADLGKRLLGALADPAERLVGALADVAERRARALADLRKRLAGALADVLDRIAGLVEQMARAASDLLDGLSDALQQLGVAIQREQHPLEDLADVVETRLEQRLRLDALDLQLDLAQVSLRADADVEQLPDLGEYGYPGIEVIDLDIDLVHLDDRDVGQDVRALLHIQVLRVDHRIVGELLPLALPARGAATIGAAAALVPGRLGGGVALDAPRLRSRPGPVVRGRRSAGSG